MRFGKSGIGVMFGKSCMAWRYGNSCMVVVNNEPNLETF